MREKKSLLDNAHHWRQREEETRTLADAMYNEETQARLLKIADEYARLVERAEQRLNESTAQALTPAHPPPASRRWRSAARPNSTECGACAAPILLVAALNGCRMLTFIALAQSKGVQFVAYESAAEGLLENVAGKFLIAEVYIQPSVVSAMPRSLAWVPDPMTR
jgi:hypothetical protein